jgi:hypothetical protein
MKELERSVCYTQGSVVEAPFSDDGEAVAGGETHRTAVESLSFADHSHLTTADLSRTAIESSFAERVSLRFALRSQRAMRE